jgi:peptide/nickel transport system permease protein
VTTRITVTNQGAAPRRRVTRNRRLRVLLRNPVTAVGATILVGFVLVTMTAPWVAPYPRDAYGSPPGGASLHPPSEAHLFGTDSLGRDVFSRVLLGARLSLEIIAMSVGLAVTVGTAIGVAAGYAPAWADEVLMRLTDIFLSLPSLVLAMVIVVTLGAGISSTTIAIALTYWPRYARLVRGETLRYRSQPFIEAGLAMGASWTRLVVRHLLPNVAPTVLVQASLDSGGALLTAASLGFLGLGARAPTPEWGLMVAIGREFMPAHWWLSAFPGLAIFVVVIGLNLVGDGLRPVLDARARVE